MSAKPDSERDPEARVRRIMTVFYPNLICPAEMWWQVLEALGAPGQLTETLESFSPELKAMIRDYYRGMQPTYYTDYLAREDRDESRALLCTRMIEWCEREPDEGASRTA